jgi:hypothetical protein
VFLCADMDKKHNARKWYSLVRFKSLTAFVSPSSMLLFPRVGVWKGMVLLFSIFLVLGAAAPARAVAHNSYLRLSEYGNAVL